MFGNLLILLFLNINNVVELVHNKRTEKELKEKMEKLLADMKKLAEATIEEEE